MVDQKLKDRLLTDRLESAQIELVKAKSALQMMIETMEPEAVSARDDSKTWSWYFCERTVETFIPLLHVAFDCVSSACQETDI